MYLKFTWLAKDTYGSYTSCFTHIGTLLEQQIDNKNVLIEPVQMLPPVMLHWLARRYISTYFNPGSLSRASHQCHFQNSFLCKIKKTLALLQGGRVGACREPQNGGQRLRLHQMTSIGAIFISTFHTKQLNPMNHMILSCLYY